MTNFLTGKPVLSSKGKTNFGLKSGVTDDFVSDSVTLKDSGGQATITNLLHTGVELKTYGNNEFGFADRFFVGSRSFDMVFPSLWLNLPTPLFNEINPAAALENIKMTLESVIAGAPNGNSSGIQSALMMTIMEQLELMANPSADFPYTEHVLSSLMVTINAHLTDLGFAGSTMAAAMSALTTSVRLAVASNSTVVQSLTELLTQEIKAYTDPSTLMSGIGLIAGSPAGASSVAASYGDVLNVMNTGFDMDTTFMDVLAMYSVLNLDVTKSKEYLMVPPNYKMLFGEDIELIPQFTKRGECTLHEFFLAIYQFLSSKLNVDATYIRSFLPNIEIDRSIGVVSVMEELEELMTAIVMYGRYQILNTLCQGSANISLPNALEAIISNTGLEGLRRAISFEVIDGICGAYSAVSAVGVLLQEFLNQNAPLKHDPWVLAQIETLAGVLGISLSAPGKELLVNGVLSRVPEELILIPDETRFLGHCGMVYYSSVNVSSERKKTIPKYQTIPNLIARISNLVGPMKRAAISNPGVYTVVESISQKIINELPLNVPYNFVLGDDLVYSPNEKAIRDFRHGDVSHSVVEENPSVPCVPVMFGPFVTGGQFLYEVVRDEMKLSASEKFFSLGYDVLSGFRGSVRGEKAKYCYEYLISPSVLDILNTNPRISFKHLGLPHEVASLLLSAGSNNNILPRTFAARDLIQNTMFDVLSANLSPVQILSRLEQIQGIDIFPEFDKAGNILSVLIKPTEGGVGILTVNSLPRIFTQYSHPILQASSTYAVDVLVLTTPLGVFSHGDLSSLKELTCPSLLQPKNLPASTEQRYYASVTKQVSIVDKHVDEQVSIVDFSSKGKNAGSDSAVAQNGGDPVINYSARTKPDFESEENFESGGSSKSDKVSESRDSDDVENNDGVSDNQGTSADSIDSESKFDKKFDFDAE